MANVNGAAWKWFGKDKQKDIDYLQLWRDAPLTYTPDQPLDFNWSVDRYEVILGQDATGDLFRRAAALVLNNRFYPSAVMDVISDYRLEGRTVREGDRVLQRIRVLWLNHRSILDALTMNKITEVTQTPRKAGFTYTTTTAQSEIGEWSPCVEWRENGEVVLLIEVVSRSHEGASAFTRRFTRRMQLRAHKLSIQYFLAQLNGGPSPVSEPHNIPAVIPAGILAATLLLFLAVFLGMRRSK